MNNPNRLAPLIILHPSLDRLSDESLPAKFHQIRQHRPSQRFLTLLRASGLSWDELCNDYERLARADRAKRGIR